MLSLLNYYICKMNYCQVYRQIKIMDAFHCGYFYENRSISLKYQKKPVTIQVGVDLDARIRP